MLLTFEQCSLSGDRPLLPVRGCSGSHEGLCSQNSFEECFYMSSAASKDHTKPCPILTCLSVVFEATQDQFPYNFHGFQLLHKNRACFWERLLLVLIYADMSLRTWCGNFEVYHHSLRIATFAFIRGCKSRHSCIYTVSHT